MFLNINSIFYRIPIWQVFMIILAIHLLISLGTLLVRKNIEGTVWILPLSPPGWRGIVVTVRAGGLPGGRLPNLWNPYLCNCLTDFLHSKFCGIVQACRCALSWSYAHLSHMGLPMGQKLVKFATNWVQTLRNAYLWNCWMDLPHFKFYGLV